MDLERLEQFLRTRKPGLMDASGRYAVLVPLVEREGKLRLLYEVRAQGMKRQPGEVCFPGGRMEPGEDPIACALRETQEELGIPASQQVAAVIAALVLIPVLLRLNRTSRERFLLHRFTVNMQALLKRLP